jgi:hypothetical protein
MKLFPAAATLTLSLFLCSCGVDWYEVLRAEHCRQHPHDAICQAPRPDGGYCPAMSPCAPGYTSIDLDGDGCYETCSPVACPAVMPVCPPGEEPMDLNGDGCALECGQVPPDAGQVCPDVLFDCAQGGYPIDADGDGCIDSCTGPYDGGVAYPAPLDAGTRP